MDPAIKLLAARMRAWRPTIKRSTYAEGVDVVVKDEGAGERVFVLVRLKTSTLTLPVETGRVSACVQARKVIAEVLRIRSATARADAGQSGQ